MNSMIFHWVVRRPRLTDALVLFGSVVQILRHVRRNDESLDHYKPQTPFILTTYIGDCSGSSIVRS